MLQGHDISNILLTIIVDGTKFLGIVSAQTGINAARNSCSTEEGKDRTNGKVVPDHVMKAYVENAGTVAFILNPEPRCNNCTVSCTFNTKRSFTRIGKWQECD
jgi:hypothetical protein